MTNYLDTIVQAQQQVAQTPTQIPAQQIEKTPDNNTDESRKFDGKTLAIAGTALGAVVAAGVLIYKGRGKQALKVFKEGLNGKTLEELKGIVPKNKHQQELLNNAITSTEKTLREAAQKAEQEAAEAAAIAAKNSEELADFIQNIQGKSYKELEAISPEGLPSDQLKALNELKAAAKHSQEVAEKTARELDDFTQSLQGKTAAQLEEISTEGITEDKIKALKTAKETATRTENEAAEAAKKAAEELKKFTEDLEGKSLKELQEIQFNNLSDEQSIALRTARSSVREKAVNVFTEDLATKTDAEIQDLEKELTKTTDKIINSAQQSYTQRYNEPFPNFDDSLTYLEKTNIEQYDEYYISRDKRLACSKELHIRKNNKITEAVCRKTDTPIKTSNYSDFATDEESRAISNYHDLYMYNDSLRNGCDPSQIQDVVLMDRVIKKAPELTQNSVVYRAVHGADPGLRTLKNSVYERQQAFVDSIKPNMIISDKSFVSTSTTATSQQFQQFIDTENNGVIMRIKLPKGTKGIYGGYNEYILPRDSQIKINSIETINGYKVADCEYLLPE